MSPNTPDLISTGIQEMVGRARHLGLVWDLCLATVKEGSDPANLKAQYDNDDQVISMVSTIGPILNGSRVYCIKVPPAGNFIVGVVASGPLVQNVECTNIFGMVPGTTASAVYATMPGTPTVSLTKTSPNSRIKVSIAGTFFSTVASAGITIGLNIDVVGVNVDITALSNTNGSLNSHCAYAGFVMLDPLVVSGGLPQGDYIFTGIWRRPAGAGTLNVDAGDIWSCCVEEVP